jgi:predicted secreted protein
MNYNIRNYHYVFNPKIEVKIPCLSHICRALSDRISNRQSAIGGKMKKNLCLFAFLHVTALSFLTLGCSMAQEQKTATIELEANATTGYTWVYTMSPKGVIQEVSSEYVPDKNNEGITGAGGKQIFTFEAIAEGEAELVFSYLREWETGVPPLKTVTYKAVVSNKNNLTLAKK